MTPELTRIGDKYAYAGVRIVTHNLTVDGPPEVVDRSWKERLWSWPWHPWVQTKTVIPQVPDKNIYHMKSQNMMSMHPIVLAQLKRDVGCKDYSHLL